MKQKRTPARTAPFDVFCIIILLSYHCCICLRSTLLLPVPRLFFGVQIPLCIGSALGSRIQIRKLLIIGLGIVHVVIPAVRLRKVVQRIAVVVGFIEFDHLEVILDCLCKLLRIVSICCFLYIRR